MNNGNVLSPFYEAVIDLYKKVDDAATLGQKVKLSRWELLVIRDALRFAMPTPLLDLHTYEDEVKDDEM